MKPGRHACLVPHCRRTIAEEKLDGFPDWICGVHWPLVPKRLKKRSTFLVRRYRKKFGNNHYSAYPGGSEKRLEALRLHRIWWKNWQIIKRTAIERAVGI